METVNFLSSLLKLSNEPAIQYLCDMEKKDQPGIYFAPLQESTDFVYRRAHAIHFGGIDKYFSPYILVQNDGSLKKSHQRDILKENCIGYTLVPQMMAGKSPDFIYLAKYLSENGYEEINWNLGCPYPMVTNKGMGSGLLPHPDQIRRILDESLPLINSRISVKLRAGLISTDEILAIIPVLNEYPLVEVILHPRVATQLYSGEPDHEVFGKVSGLCRHELVYNGDLTTSDDFDRVREKFAAVSRWMIGRGMLKNPFLALEIKGRGLPGKVEKIAMLERFHDDIVGNYAAMLSGQRHLIIRMTKFWEYFSFLFPNPHKAFKRVKKSTSMAKYQIAVGENFLQLRSEE